MNTAKLRPLLPLLLINGGAAYAQGAYAFEEIAPDAWNSPSKVVFALAFALAMESIAVYVQWHAHDALLLKAYATAAALRRASWVIAAVVAGINYAHFADGIQPTAASVAFALLSLLSPWLWGLHTRRAQHVQLLAEDSNLIDHAGVEFSPQRRRAFPIRSWQAKRWAIDHGERDPLKAWEGYNAERRQREAAKQAAKRKPTPPATNPPTGETLTAIVDATTPATVATPAPATSPPPRPAKRTPTRAAKTRQTTAERVATAVAKRPAMTQAEAAKFLGISERSVQRYWPKPAATVNGHDHSEVTHG